VFREDARTWNAVAYLLLSLALLTVLLLHQTPLSSAPRLLSVLAAILLPTGLNRLLGTGTVFDINTGTVIVSRTLGLVTVFRRRFRMDSVIRVFNDRCAYIRRKIQNPKIQLLSGKQVNLCQWCPAEFDFEVETYAANRMHASEEARKAEVYSATLGDASPCQWRLEDLDALAIQENRRNTKIVKRAGWGLALSLIYC
jgi:hypothetical protein